MCPATDILLPTLNFISREYDDPLVHLFAQYLGFATAPWQQFAVLQGIFFLGAMYLLWLRGVSLLHCLLGALSISCALIAFRGTTPYLFIWQWFPFLVSAFLRVRLRSNWFSLLLSLLVVAIWSISSGSMSCVGLLLAFMLSRTLEQRTEQVILESAGRRERYSAVLLGAGLLFAFWIMPVFPTAQYPQNIRIVPISPLDFYAEPAFGPYFQQNHLLYPEYRLLLKTFSARLLAIAAILSFVLLPPLRTRRNWSSYGWGIFVLVITGLFCCGELLLPNDLAQHAPYPTMGLLIPGLPLAVPWLLVPGGLAAAMFILLKAAGTRRIVIAALGMVVLAAVSMVYPWSLAAPETYLARKALSNESEASVAARLHSPSSYIARLYGPWVVADGVGERRSIETLTRLVKGEDVMVTAQAQPLPEQAALAVDGDSATRWSTGRPQQPGDWFELHFAPAVSLLRVALSVKESPSDFPRGISVEAGDSAGTLKEIVHLPDWPGALHWTTDGYPYFAGQSEVLIDLPEEQTVRVLRFTQLSQEPHFDWSVREVKLYSSAKPTP